MAKDPVRDTVLTRRQVLAGIGVGGVAMALGGCGGVTRNPTPGAPTSTAVGAQPITLKPGTVVERVIYGDLLPKLPRGGALDLFVTQEPPTLDIMANTLGAVQQAADPAHDFLERFDHTGTLLPSLAQKLEVVSPTTLRYTLHEAKFHNGRAVTAEDVLKSIEYLRDPKTASTKASGFADVKVTVVDERTVELSTPQTNVGLRYLLPQIPIVPVEEAASFASAPVGCGPFRFKRYVKGSSVEYERNPDYWNKDAPRVDSLKVSFRTDQAAAAQAFLAGEGDVLAEVASQFVPQLRSMPQDQMRTVVGTSSFTFFAFNTSRPQLRDPRVRRAIRLAIDKRAMTAAFDRSIAETITIGVLSPNHPWYPKNLKEERNLDEARSLLRQAGQSRLRFRVVFVSESYEAMALVAKSNLAEVGIEIEPQRIDVTSYRERRSAGDFDSAISGWFSGVEPASILDALFVTGASSNYWRYSDKRTDQLLATGRTTLDEETRKRTYQQVAEKIFLQDCPMIAISTEAVLYAGRPYTNIEQYRPDPLTWHYPIASRRQ
jgi:peptide/nickel transport system substrate-binding protein